ncbi:MAG: HTTM domain-containing protein [Acidimicrobiia bacterium]
MTELLFAPRSVAPVALCRAAWGLLVAVWALTLIPDVPDLVAGGSLAHPVDGLGRWNPVATVTGPTGLTLVCLAVVAGGLLTSVGLWTTASTAATWLGVVGLQRTSPLVINSGDVLIRHLGLVLVFAPAGAMLSVDARRRARRGVVRSTRRAPVALRYLQLFVATGYLWSALAKLRGPSWHDGTAMALALRIDDMQRVALPDWVFDQTVALNLLTWAVLGFELFFCAAVWNRALRPWVLGAGIVLHAGIEVLVDVGFFSWAVMVAYLSFVPFETADHVVEAIEARLARLARLGRARPATATVPVRAAGSGVATAGADVAERRAAAPPSP